MQISEIRIKLVENRSDRLKAFCSVTFDNQFVIRDLKIIEGADGFFVAMPSRKLTDRCPKCGSKNHLRAKFCNECGGKRPESRDSHRGPRTKLHADIAHPINTESREYIQKEILASFQKELDLSQQPGYQPPRMDSDEDYMHDTENSAGSAPPPSVSEETSVEPPPEEPKEGAGFGDGII